MILDWQRRPGLRIIETALPVTMSSVCLDAPLWYFAIWLNGEASVPPPIASI